LYREEERWAEMKERRGGDEDEHEHEVHE